MKILLVATVAGTLRSFLAPIARRLRAEGFSVHGAARGFTGAEWERAFDAVHEIPWSRNPARLDQFVASIRAIQAVVDSGDFAIVHVHTPVAGFVTRLALRQRRPAVVYTAHGFHFHSGASLLRNAVFRSLEGIAGRWMHALVVINQEDLAAASNLSLPQDVRVVFMPGIGVDTKVVRPEAVSNETASSLRAELGLDPTRATFLCVAEFNPGKRHRDIVEAVARMTNTAAVVLFAGTGRELDPVRRLAKRLGVDHRLRFLGYRNDIPALMAVSDAVVLASEREGLPRSLMEAQAMARMVIGAHTRGIRELVTERNGVLFPVGDVTALARALDWTSSNREPCASMGKAGREDVIARDVDRITELHMQLYRGLVTRCSTNG